MQLLALVNEQLWLGHFDLWQAEGVIMYRNALLLTEGMEAGTAQLEAMLAAAVEACERYYQAFQFVIWAGKTSGGRARGSALRDARRSLSAMIAGRSRCSSSAPARWAAPCWSAGWRAASMPSEVTILDPYLEGDRWAELARAGTATATSVAEAADRAYRVMVLAVKPQSMAEALAQVRALAAPDTTILSIAAGVRLATLEAAFPPARRSSAPCPTRRRRSA